MTGWTLVRRSLRFYWRTHLAVLLASITVVGRALRDDRRLRRRQQNFLAAVSHEFKSPLAAARIAAARRTVVDFPLVPVTSARGIPRMTDQSIVAASGMASAAQVRAPAP